MKQMCFPVENRKIIKELLTGIYGLPHIQDFETLGKFFDDNYHTITELIAKYYQYRLSGSRNCRLEEINARVNALFDNCFANLYPFMGKGEFQTVKMTFQDILSRAFDARVEHPGIIWEKCELISVSLDSYVVNCYKVEDNVPLPIAA